MKKVIGRIGVLMGGPSDEREISIKSGKAVYNALISLGLDCVKIDVKDETSLRKDAARNKIEIAFIALHGRFGEDGTAQAILEDMHIPYTGSGPEASRLALNKILSKRIFQKNKIPTPLFQVVKKSERGKLDIERFSLPAVVKPVNEGSSIGMSIADDEASLIPAIDEALSYDDEVIIEEYISGDDITVGILNEKPLPVVHIRPKERFYSYRAKYAPNMCEYNVPAAFSKGIVKKAQRFGIMSHRALGCCSFSRVDMLFDEKNNKVYVLEVNTIPGLTSNSLLPKAADAAGINFANMCLRMVQSSQKGVSNYGKKEKKETEKVKAK